MTDDIRMIYLLNWIIIYSYVTLMFPKRMRTIETTIIITKSNFERKLSSLSNLPIFVRASREFIDILVSFPVYITIARIFPEASTVLAQSVFSSLSDYLMMSPFGSFSLSSPENSYIFSIGSDKMTEALVGIKSCDLNLDWMLLIEFRSFQSVSPSN